MVDKHVCPDTSELANVIHYKAKPSHLPANTSPYPCEALSPVDRILVSLCRCLRFTGRRREAKAHIHILQSEQWYLNWQ